jgi:hypothetical protein
MKHLLRLCAWLQWITLIAAHAPLTRRNLRSDDPVENQYYYCCTWSSNGALDASACEGRCKARNSNPFCIQSESTCAECGGFRCNTADEPATRVPSIIFRLEDVQDDYLSNEAAEIIDKFLEKDLVLSVCVIGGQYFTGKDATIFAKVQEAVQRGCEVVNLGDGSLTLLDEVSIDVATAHIINGEVAAFKPYTTFVPYEGRWSASTLDALRELGYNVVSGSTRSIPPMPVDPFLLPKQLPYSTQTGAQVKLWIDTFSDVIPDCEIQLELWSLCVVVMHPQEFAGSQENALTKEQAFANLANLIDEVQAKQWDVTTFYVYDFVSNLPPNSTYFFPTAESNSSSGASPLLLLFLLIFLLPITAFTYTAIFGRSGSPSLKEISSRKEISAGEAIAIITDGSNTDMQEPRGLGDIIGATASTVEGVTERTSEATTKKHLRTKKKQRKTRRQRERARPGSAAAEKNVE